MAKTGNSGQKNKPRQNVSAKAGAKNVSGNKNRQAAPRQAAPRQRVTWNHNKVFLISTIVCLVPFVLSIYFYKMLPDQIATHWSLAGEILGYSSKKFVTFTLPAILLLSHLLLYSLLEREQRKENQPASIRAIIRFIIPALSLMLQIVFIVNAVITPVNLTFWLLLLIGVLMILLAVFMPKLKQNFTIGYKLYWTMADPENWAKTHRFASILWYICGALIIADAFLLIPWLVVAAVLAALLLPVLYSFLTFMRKWNREQPKPR